MRMVARFAGGITLAAVVVSLSGCTGATSSGVNKEYLVTTNVVAVDCTVDPSVKLKDLRATVGFVNSASDKEASDILRRNEGATSLDSLKEALNSKITACSPAQSSAPINGTGTPAPWVCPAGFVQNFDPNKGGNFASEGVKNTDDELALMGKDARYLGFRAENLGFVTSTDPSPLLVPGNACLSQEGQNVWNMMKGALTGKGVTVDPNGEVPANYYNTGMVNGQPAVDSQPGIGGDRSATVYTLRDGTKVYVMHRCANLGLPSQGNLPKAVTNHQRPPGTTVTPPPDDDKIPPQGSGPQGHAPEGNDRNIDPGPGVQQPYTPGPATPRGDEPAPPPAGVPTDSTPTSHPTATTQPGTDPDDGSGNDGRVDP